MTFVRSTHGPAVHAEPPRRLARLTPEQILARRNEDWRIDHEVGRYNPDTRQCERRSTLLIARLAGVSQRTVRLGIARARRLREAVHALAG